MSKNIFISPSNQNGNKYAYGNTTEDIECGKIGRALEAALIRCGQNVKLEQYDTMQNRVAHSNSWKADMHIAIHTNAYDGKVGGTRCFYYANNGYGNVATQAVYDELKGITPGKSDAISAYPSLYELKYTDATAVYVEVEFHDVAEYARWITENTMEIAEAICKGICKYYKLTYVEPVTSPEGSDDVYKDTLIAIKALIEKAGI